MSDIPEIVFRKTHNNAQIPEPPQNGETGWNLHNPGCYTLQSILSPSFNSHIALIRFGLEMALPRGYFAYIVSGFNQWRDGLVVKDVLYDHSNHDEIMVEVINLSHREVYINTGEVVAKIILLNSPTLGKPGNALGYSEYTGYPEFRVREVENREELISDDYKIINLDNIY